MTQSELNVSLGIDDISILYSLYIVEWTYLY